MATIAAAARPMTITAASVKPTRCSRAARSSASAFCLRWALLRRFLGYQARLRAFGAIPIDARQPLSQVVDAILSRTLASSAGRASKRGNQSGMRAPGR